MKEFIHLIKVSINYLYQTRDYSAFGVKVIKKSLNLSGHYPAIFKYIFPKSCAWIDLKYAIIRDPKNTALIEHHVNRLFKYKNMFTCHLYANLGYDIFGFLKTNYNELFLKMYTDISNQIDVQTDIESTFEQLKKNPGYISSLNLFVKNRTLHLPIKKTFSSDEFIISKNQNYLNKFKPPSPIIEKDYSAHKEHAINIQGLTLMQITDGYLVEGYQVITKDYYACYDLSALPEFSFIAGFKDTKPLYFDTSKSKKHVFLQLRSCLMHKIERGFLISGRCTENYFHWLIEYLPKLLWLKQDIQNLNNISLLVDSGMPAQHYQAINYCMKILGLKNEILYIDLKKSVYQIGSLYLSSNPSFIPDALDLYSVAESSGLDLDTLKKIRDFLVSDLNNKHDRLIYISRFNRAGRKIINEDEVIALFQKYGFEIVYPENLSFEEQINLFNSAKFIAGSSGAGFSNVLFCQQNTTIINFLPSEVTEFSVFKNLASLSGSTYYAETGPYSGQRLDYCDEISWKLSSYSLDINDLDLKLKKLLYAK